MEDKLERTPELSETKQSDDAVSKIWKSIEEKAEEFRKPTAEEKFRKWLDDLAESNEKLNAVSDKEDGDNVVTDSVEEETKINPEDFLSEEQIEKIKNKYKELGYSDEEIGAKLEEYARKAKACKEAEEKGLENLSNKEKGNYGEMKTDLDMLDNGYVRISKDGVTSLDKPLEQGIDGVYQNPNGKPPFVILDAKFGSSQLQDTKDGKQLSGTWIDARLDDAVGKEKADEIREAMIDDDASVAVARIDADGEVTYTAVDADGESINGKEVFLND